jgi:hypothetical protein
MEKRYLNQLREDVVFDECSRRSSGSARPAADFQWDTELAGDF